MTKRRKFRPQPAVTMLEDLPDGERKRYPLATGLLDYFPDAALEVAHVSLVAQDQHNPGKPLEWDKSKSSDHDNTLLRHFLQRGTRDKDGLRHRAKVAWRAFAALQIEIDKERAAAAKAAKTRKRGKTTRTLAVRGGRGRVGTKGGGTVKTRRTRR